MPIWIALFVLYVLAIHIAKAWDLDFIGFSHELHCRSRMHPSHYAASDARLYVTKTILMTYLVVGGLLLLSEESNHRQSHDSSSRNPTVAKQIFSVTLLWFVMHVAWMTTLFPISGIVKVGTLSLPRVFLHHRL